MRLGGVFSEYRGATTISHAGGVPGMVTLFTIVPEKHVAFALFTNAEEPGALSSMQFRLLDHYLGLKSPDWIAAVDETFKERLAKAKEQLAAGKGEEKDEQGSKGPSLPIEKYAGRYRDAWYGTMTIERAGEGIERSVRQHAVDDREAGACPLRHVSHEMDGSEY